MKRKKEKGSFKKDHDVLVGILYLLSLPAIFILVILLGSSAKTASLSLLVLVTYFVTILATAHSTHGEKSQTPPQRSQADLPATETKQFPKSKAFQTLEKNPPFQPSKRNGAQAEEERGMELQKKEAIFLEKKQENRPLLSTDEAVGQMPSPEECSSAADFSQEDPSTKKRVWQRIALWHQQAEETKKLYPDFDLNSAANNPQFLSLLRGGMSVRQAFEAAFHPKAASAPPSCAEGSPETEARQIVYQPHTEQAEQTESLTPASAETDSAAPNEKQDAKKKLTQPTVLLPLFLALCAVLCFVFYQIGFSASASHYQEKYDTGYRSGRKAGYDQGNEEGYQQGYTEGYAKAKEEFVKPIPLEQGKVYVKPTASCVAPFTVATSDENTYVFLDYTDDSRDIGFCIKANTSYKRNVPLGDAKLYYATGSQWYGLNYGLSYCFGEETVWNSSNETFSFTADSSYYYGHKITLYPVEDGNFDTYEVPPDRLPFAG